MKRIPQAISHFAIAAVLAVSVIRASAIVGGELDGARHPAVCAIMYYDPAMISPISQVIGPGPLPLASGVLIHGRVVLTAGHVVAQNQPVLDAGLVTLDQVFVTFNPDASVVADFHAVASWSALYSQLFNAQGVQLRNAMNDDDVGAIVLKSTVIGIAPALLAPSEFLTHKTQKELSRGQFLAVGYGSVLNFPPPQIDFSDPQRRVANLSFLTVIDYYGMFQANPRAGHEGICFGDSGGPVFWREPESGQELIIGVTSLIPGLEPCLSTCMPYRMDLPQAQQFIENIITGL